MVYNNKLSFRKHRASAPVVKCRTIKGQSVAGSVAIRQTKAVHYFPLADVCDKRIQVKVETLVITQFLCIVTRAAL